MDGNPLEQRYDLEFAGETLPGFDEPTVRRAVAALFKADERTLNRLFSGDRLRIKQDCDAATAQRFEDALERVGAKIYRVVQPSAESSDAAPEQRMSESPDWSLAPAGSLIPGIPRPTGSAPDTSTLSLAPVGVTLGESAEEPPAKPAPDWTLAPLGADSTNPDDGNEPAR
jgi:hypothetical protein